MVSSRSQKQGTRSSSSSAQDSIESSSDESAEVQETLGPSSAANKLQSDSSKKAASKSQGDSPLSSLTPARAKSSTRLISVRHARSQPKQVDLYSGVMERFSREREEARLARQAQVIEGEKAAQTEREALQSIDEVEKFRQDEQRLKILEAYREKQQREKIPLKSAQSEDDYAHFDSRSYDELEGTEIQNREMQSQYCRAVRDLPFLKANEEQTRLYLRVDRFPIGNNAQQARFFHFNRTEEDAIEHQVQLRTLFSLAPNQENPFKGATLEQVANILSLQLL